MLCFNVVTVLVQNCKLDVNGNLLVWKCKETLNVSIVFVVVSYCVCLRMKIRENLGNSHVAQHCDVLWREGKLMLMSIRSCVMLHLCGVVILDI